MKKFLAVCALMVIFPLSLVAQEPLASKIVIPAPGRATTLFLLNNTVDDSVLFFYQRLDNPYSQYPYTLYVRVIKPDGAISSPEKLAVSNASIFRVVWHPQAKRYMVVFQKNNQLYAVGVRLNGTAYTPIRQIGPSLTAEIAIAPALKNKFVVFYKKDNQLLARSLKNTAQKFRGERVLKTFTSNSQILLFGTAQEKNGQSVVYVVERISNANNAPFFVVRTNHKLKKINSLNPFTIAVNKQRLFALPAYDESNRVHMVFWSNKYCVFDESGTILHGPAPHNQGNELLALNVDPTTRLFALLRVDQTTSPPWKSKFYLSNYNEFGTNVSGPISLFTETSNYVGGEIMAYFGDGKYLVLWYYPDYVGQQNYYGYIF